MAIRSIIVDEGTPGKFAWKCETEDFESGAKLVVHPSQKAIFVNNGQLLGVLEPGMHTLNTDNILFLRRLNKAVFGRYYHCQVYYVNEAIQMDIPWGTRTPIHTMLQLEPGKSVPLAVGAHGSMRIQADPEQTEKLVVSVLGTGEALTDVGIRQMFQAKLDMVLKSHLSKVLQESDKLAFALDQHLSEFSADLFQKIAPDFAQYGVILRDFILDNIALPEDSHILQEARLLQEQRYMKHGQLDLDTELRLKTGQADLAAMDLEGQKDVLRAGYDAKAATLKAQAEATRRSLEGITSVQEHQFDTINSMVGTLGSFGQGGVGQTSSSIGGEMSGVMGDMMRMGAAVQMMNGMGNMMGNIMSPMQQTMNSVVQGSVGGWTCSCGHQNQDADRFCGGCGAPKPASQPAGWTCSCGRQNGADTRFCGACGAPRPTANDGEWICSQGHRNDADRAFCGECGEKRG